MRLPQLRIRSRPAISPYTKWYLTSEEMRSRLRRFPARLRTGCPQFPSIARGSWSQYTPLLREQPLSCLYEVSGTEADIQIARHWVPAVCRGFKRLYSRLPIPGLDLTFPILQIATPQTRQKVEHASCSFQVTQVGCRFKSAPRRPDCGSLPILTNSSAIAFSNGTIGAVRIVDLGKDIYWQEDT